MNSLISDDGQGLLHRVLIPALLRDRDNAEQALHQALNHVRYTEALAQLNEHLELDQPPTRQLGALVRRLSDVLLNPALARGQVRAVGVTFQPRLTQEQTAERFVIGVIAGMGAVNLQTWGGWMGQAMRKSWTVRPNTPLRAVEDALLKLELAEERVKAKLSAVSSAPDEDTGCPGGAPDHGEVHRAPGRFASAATGPSPAAAEDEEELPEQLIDLYAEEALANPAYASMAKWARSNPALLRRVVRMHLLDTGVLSAEQVG